MQASIIRYLCDVDECSEIFESGPGDSLNLARLAARDLGWNIRQQYRTNGGDDDYCPNHADPFKFVKEELKKRYPQFDDSEIEYFINSISKVATSKKGR